MIADPLHAGERSTIDLDTTQITQPCSCAPVTLPATNPPRSPYKTHGTITRLNGYVLLYGRFRPVDGELTSWRLQRCGSRHRTVIDPRQAQLVADRSLVLWAGLPFSQRRLYGYTFPAMRPVQINLPARVQDVGWIALNNERVYIGDALGHTWALARTAIRR